MIYLTGDTHGGSDVKKLVNRKVTDKLTAADTLIICGDFGFVWDRKKETNKEKTWLDWFGERPWTTVFVDGNHECFPRLTTYPEETWHGGLIHKLRPNLFHLERGNVFQIEDKTVFAMGGGRSHDRGPAVGDTKAVIGKSWWPEEIPSKEEFETGRKNLAKVNNRVNLIITHCLPTAFQEVITEGKFPPDDLTVYLEEIKDTVQYDYWYCGHYHKDQDMNDHITVLFNKVIAYGETVGKSEAMLGSPIYKKGDEVNFKYNGEDLSGTIVNVYAWGTMSYRFAPVYDIKTSSSNKNLQIPETYISGK